MMRFDPQYPIRGMLDAFQLELDASGNAHQVFSCVQTTSIFELYLGVCMPSTFDPLRAEVAATIDHPIRRL